MVFSWREENKVIDTLNRSYFLQLYLDRESGRFELRYSDTVQGPWTRTLFVITADQADKMHGAGWPIVQSGET